MGHAVKRQSYPDMLAARGASRPSVHVVALMWLFEENRVWDGEKPSLAISEPSWGGL